MIDRCAQPLSALIDGDGRIVDANTGLVELLGPSASQVNGASLGSFLAPEWRSEVLSQIDLAAGESSDSAVQWCGRRSDGLPWCADFSGWRPMAWTDQVVLSGLRRFGPVAWVDEVDLEVDPRLSVGVDSVVSHDIRGALRGASGFLSVVKRVLDDPAVASLHERLAKAGDHLEIAARSTATADEIAEKVVHFMRWAKCPFAMRPAALGPLVRQAVALSHETFEAAPAEVHLGELPEVVADVEHVRWAVAEIITNSRKFSSHAVRVELTATVEDGYCTVSVSDDGPGIDPDLTDDAFLAGRQLQPRGDFTGVGMGLTLCQLVFERHAGWCRVKSRGDSARHSGGESGTTILFRLPSSSG